MSPTKTKSKKAPAKKAPAKKPAAKKAPAKKAAAKKASTNKATTEAAKPAEPKHGTLCHFEFYAPDISAAGKTYADLFGWQVFPFQPTEIYVQTSASMGGCIMQGTPATGSTTVLYVKVDDIETSIAKGATLGAELVKGKTEIPGGHGFFAQLRMPEGNTVGIWNMR
jgi:predicted enzyme related to lactoylglutathione lyase